MGNLGRTSFVKFTYNSGMSLIEVLVAFGLMSILAMGVGTLIQNMQSEVKSLNETMVAKDVEISLKTALLSSNYCDCIFKGQTFNTQNLESPWSSAISSLPRYFSSNGTSCLKSATELVPSVGNTIANSYFRVDSIGMENISAVGPSGTEFQGELVVKFKVDGLSKPANPIRSLLSFSVDGSQNTPNDRPFVSCYSSSGGGESATQFFYSQAAVSANEYPVKKNGLKCQKQKVAIEYGGKMEPTREDSAGDMVLYVNGSEVSRRRVGGQVAKADLTQMPDSGYAIWVGDCNGTIDFAVKWAPSFHSPKFSGGFAKVNHVDASKATVYTSAFSDPAPPPANNSNSSNIWSGLGGNTDPAANSNNTTWDGLFIDPGGSGG